MEQKKIIKIVMIANLLIFVGLAVFDLIPFAFSKEYLIKQTNQDLKQFIQTDSVIESPRYTFLKRENNATCAYSKYTNYYICSGGR